MTTASRESGILRNMISSKAILLLSALCVGLSFVAGCGDRQESFYPSLTDADKDGAITRGWIPDDLVPRGSRAIHEVHELSPSTEWCAFEFPPTDSQGLRNKLRSVDALTQPPGLANQIRFHHLTPGKSAKQTCEIADREMSQLALLACGGLETKESNRRYNVDITCHY